MFSLRGSNLKIIRFLIDKISFSIFDSIRSLSKKKKLSETRRMVEGLHKTIYCYNKKKPRLWNSSYPDHNLCTQQKIVQKIGFLKLSTFFIYFQGAGKKLIFVLSSSWIKKLEDSGFKVNTFLSKILNIFLFISFFIEGLVYFFKILYLYSKFQLLQYGKRIKDLENLVIFVNISSKDAGNECKSKFTLAQWFKENISKNNNTFYVDKKLDCRTGGNSNNLPDPLFLYIINLNIFSFLYHGLKFFFLMILDLLILNFTNLILLKENLESLIVKKSTYNRRIDFYYVYTQNICRPLWTYEVLKQKSSVSVIMLNIINEMRLSKDLNYTYDHEAYHLSTWDNYYVWSNKCADFLNYRIRECSNFIKNNLRFEKKGLIFSGDTDKVLNLDHKRSISLFTYEFHRLALGISTMAEWQLRGPEILTDFYADILEAVRELDIQLIVKRKKIMTKNQEREKMTIFWKILEQNSNVTLIDPRHSAYKVILKTNMTISQPFTSTGYAAEFLNKPSLYYDPTASLYPNDPAAGNVQVIGNKILLKKWIIDNMNKEV